MPPTPDRPTRHTRPPSAASSGASVGLSSAASRPPAASPMTRAPQAPAAAPSPSPAPTTGAANEQERASAPAGEPPVPPLRAADPSPPGQTARTIGVHRSTTSSGPAGTTGTTVTDEERAAARAAAVAAFSALGPATQQALRVAAQAVGAQGAQAAGDAATVERQTAAAAAQQAATQAVQSAVQLAAAQLQAAPGGGGGRATAAHGPAVAPDAELLTPNAIARMWEGYTHDSPVVQILELRSITAPPVLDSATHIRYRVVLSDGTQYMQGMLATRNNDDVARGAIRQHSIVSLDEAIVNSVQGRNIVVVIALSVLRLEAPLIGRPTRINTPGLYRTAPMSAGDMGRAPGRGIHRSTEASGVHWPQPLSIPADVDETDAPDALVCPITQALMREPALVTTSGRTYERSALMQWVSSHHTDPLDRKPLCIHQLVPNLAVRQLVDAYVAKQTGFGAAFAPTPPAVRSFKLYWRKLRWSRLVVTLLGGVHLLLWPLTMGYRWYGRELSRSLRLMRLTAAVFVSAIGRLTLSDLLPLLPLCWLASLLISRGEIDLVRMATSVHELIADALLGPPSEPPPPPPSPPTPWWMPALTWSSPPPPPTPPPSLGVVMGSCWAASAESGVFPRLWGCVAQPTMRRVLEGDAHTMVGLVFCWWLVLSHWWQVITDVVRIIPAAANARADKDGGGAARADGAGAGLGLDMGRRSQQRPPQPVGTVHRVASGGVPVVDPRRAARAPAGFRGPVI